MHRSISWIGRAELEKQDPDAAFLFLWIAFNAAYAGEDEDTPPGERRQFVEFIDQLVVNDDDGRLYEVIWGRFQGPIRRVMQNRFVYRPFWLNQNGITGNENWARKFRASAERFVRAMADRDTAHVLREVFDRLYTLRCQIMHGSSTWNGKVNREQVRDGATILREVVPVMVDIMMDHPDEDWGCPLYPVVSPPVGRGRDLRDKV